MIYLPCPALARVIELLLTRGWLDLVSSTGGLLLGQSGGSVGGQRGGIGHHQLLLRLLSPFQRWTEHAAEQVAYSSSGAWGDKEAMAAGGRLVKSVAVISIVVGQRLARPSRGLLLVWVLVWTPRLSRRLCLGSAEDRGVRAVCRSSIVVWWSYGGASLLAPDNPTLFALGSHQG